MTLRALVDSFSSVRELPVPVDDVLAWIRANTDHKIITLHGVERSSRAYRGAFRRRSIPIGGLYGAECEIHTDILYGSDLPEEWKRLVIVKEAIHVFDGPTACVTTPASLEKLIPAMISPEVSHLPETALNDHFGVYRAMSVLMPAAVRHSLSESVENSSRSVDEIARYARLPDNYVDIWLRYGDQFERAMFTF